MSSPQVFCGSWIFMKYYSNKQNTSVAHITVLHNANVKNLTFCDTDLELLVFITRSYIIYIVSVKIIALCDQACLFLVTGQSEVLSEYSGCTQYNLM
jgi:hypothetical protein